MAKRNASNNGQYKPLGGQSLIIERKDERIILKRGLGEYCEGYVSLLWPEAVACH